MTRHQAAGRRTQNSAYHVALVSGHRKGMAHANDAELMAALLDSTLQVLAGAFSPELVWNGAQKAGLTAKQVQALVTRRDFRALDNLMWS